MNKDSQRIAIAEACGHKMDSPKDFPTVGIHENGARYLIPDYLSDLNAMHEAEKVLQSDNAINPCGQTKWQRYQYQLDMVTNYCSTHATAAQRAEAFLRTLGLWKEAA